ncbi:MAG: OmpA family protein [Hyphomicrobiaceae bacterium]|nr:OmpA family protein [Hyphomicrobiaceae bacterium]
MLRKVLAIGRLCAILALPAMAALSLSAAPWSARAQDAAGEINDIIRSLSPTPPPPAGKPGDQSGGTKPDERLVWVELPDSRPPARVLVNYKRSLAMRLMFEKNEAGLTESARKALRVLAAALKSPALANSRYLVTGHTDTIGSAAYNKRLSDRRANSVRRFLVRRQGITADRLISIGLGEEPFAGHKVGKGPEYRVVRIGLIVRVDLSSNQ